MANNQGEVRALLITITEALKLIGMSRESFRRARAAGSIPAPVSIRTADGTIHRYRRAELEAWVACGCPDPKEWKWAMVVHGKVVEES